jgi:DegV family protein with EDD domain
MSGKTGIVCDSTCDLGPDWLREHDVVMVPLKVTFGDRSYLDWVELPPERFFEMLASADTLPKTSQPSPADFTAAYRKLAEEGCTEIVSIHLTSALSGTMESVLMAAANAPVPVRAIDTKKVVAGLSLPLMAALEARDRGEDADGIEAAARAVVSEQRLLFALDTLEYLVKGGRAGKAQGLAAAVLNIKPVLTFNDDGIIEPFVKVKGTRKALAAMADEVVKAAGPTGRVRVAFLHAQAPDLVAELRSALEATGADLEFVTESAVGAVIGTYAGPRAIGVGFHPVH